MGITTGVVWAGGASTRKPELMNNTRITYSNKSNPRTFVSPSAEDCLARCVNDTQCGAIVFAEAHAHEPTPAPRSGPGSEPTPSPRAAGCAGQRPGIDGCCYLVPPLPHYQIVPTGKPATYGFVAAVVRYGAPAPAPAPPPSWWIPAEWAPSYEMNKSISLYWRNGTGIEPPEYYDGYGLVIFDWAHAAQYWINHYQPMDNGAGLARQCEVTVIARPCSRHRTCLFCASGPQKLNPPLPGVFAVASARRLPPPHTHCQERQWCRVSESIIRAPNDDGRKRALHCTVCRTKQ